MHWAAGTSHLNFFLRRRGDALLLRELLEDGGPLQAGSPLSSSAAVPSSPPGQMPVSREAGRATPSKLHACESNSVVLIIIHPKLVLGAGAGRVPC